MIKIRLTSLEDVKRNPSLYAQQLAAENAKTSGGTHGMFAYWQDIVKTVHLNQLTTSEAIKTLQQKFLRFDDNPKNIRKQELLLEQLAIYCNAYDKYKFALADGRRQIKWELYAGVMLTGLTPIVAHNDEGYYAYFFSENPYDWEDQLRFPLIQQYLSDYSIHCDIGEMNVGIYCLATGKFEFLLFTKSQLNKAIIQTSSLFEKVEKEYTNLKTKSNVLR